MYILLPFLNVVFWLNAEYLCKSNVLLPQCKNGYYCLRERLISFQQVQIWQLNNNLSMFHALCFIGFPMFFSVALFGKKNVMGAHCSIRYKAFNGLTLRMKMLYLSVSNVNRLIYWIVYDCSLMKLSKLRDNIPSL